MSAFWSTNVGFCTALAACSMALLIAPVLADIDPELRGRLQELEAKTAQVTDMTADFEEQTFSTLLRRPITSHGTVRVRGERTRWDTIEPRPTTMLTSPDEVQIYYPSMGTLEIYPVLEYLRPVVVSPMPRLTTIQRSFRVERGAEAASGTLNIVLKPFQKQLAEFVAEVRVEIDESTGFARRVEMQGADGDRTVLVFSNLRFNTGLSDTEVNFVPPANTKIVRPLSSGSKAAKGGSVGKDEK